ncbi:kinase-like protein [Teratosphaeria nubilosa]|uniref:non-specific serine/threonine protein kinase n=1 Tax=Teratosphaeria nubilosa TaxID=161662 RepID=A0A6G1LAX6_9PEZI|nr:kinase-like protein [Teratosphaeria nubilosa]
MSASYRPRAQSMDGYRSFPPSSRRPASLDRADISYYHPRRHSASYIPAGLPPRHGFPIVHGDQYDRVATPYEADPAVVTRRPIGRGCHGVSPRTRMKVELFRQARRQGRGPGAVELPMKMPAPGKGVKLSISAALRQAGAAARDRQLMPIASQLDMPGARADPVMMAAMMGQMQAGGGGVDHDMLNARPRARAEEALAMVHRGHGRKKQHVRFKDFTAPFANLFRGGGHQRRGNAKDISVPGYSLVKKLSPGGMSDAVNLVKNKSSGKLYIEKRVKFANGRRQDPMKKRAKAELRALRKAHGPHLNRMVEHLWSEDKGFVSFILEYCDGGSLESMVKEQQRKGRHFKENFLWHVLAGIGKGLAYLHHGIRDATKDKKIAGWDSICHLDLKPTNIFFQYQGKDTHPRVVIGDFGCSITSSDIQLGMEHARLQVCGTPDWYPPEGRPEIAGRNTRYGPETDIWQMGATIHTIAHFIPAPDVSIYEFTNEWSACGTRYSRRLNAVVMWCCFADRQWRPSAARLVKEVMSQRRR